MRFDPFIFPAGHQSSVECERERRLPGVRILFSVAPLWRELLGVTFATLFSHLCITSWNQKLSPIVNLWNYITLKISWKLTLSRSQTTWPGRLANKQLRNICGNSSQKIIVGAQSVCLESQWIWWKLAVAKSFLLYKRICFHHCSCCAWNQGASQHLNQVRFLQLPEGVFVLKRNFTLSIIPFLKTSMIYSIVS